MTTTATDLYARVLAAEPRLRRIERMVRAQVLYVRPESLRSINSTLEPTTETEEWLRTSEAFDAVTDRLLAILHDADPGNGHGFTRHD